jgi:hypothetical protein
MLEGKRVAGAAVDQVTAVDHDRAEQRGNRDRGGDRFLQVALRQDALRPAVEVAGHDLQRNGELLECGGQQLEARHEGIEDQVRVELRRQRTAAQEVGEGERPRPPEPAEHFPALRIEGAGALAHLAPGDARRVARPDDRADGGAGDLGRLQAELVERLADEDMGHAPGAAAAQSETDTRLHRHGPLPSPGESGGGRPRRQAQFRDNVDTRG